MNALKTLDEVCQIAFQNLMPIRTVASNVRVYFTPPQPALGIIIYIKQVVMDRCESWTIKKNEHQRIDAFILWCWRRLLRVPWTARRSNQSILKDINPEYSLEGLILKLNLQYFGHLMQRANSLEKTLILGKIEGRRRRGWQRMGQLDDITNSVDISLSKLHKIVKDREAWRAAVHKVSKTQTQLGHYNKHNQI